jgi:HPt (histidine-containing phosphotransfer) domain-containing protein
VLDEVVVRRLFALDAATGEKMALALFDVFLADAERRIQVLERCLTQGNSEGVWMEAHSLKGSAGSVGANRMANVAAEIEGSADGAWPASSRGWAERLRRELDEFSVELRAFLSVSR